MIIFLYFLSAALGMLMITALNSGDRRLPISIQIILGIGLGLGISAHLVFSSFLFWDRLNPSWVWALHIVFLLVWTGAFVRWNQKSRWKVWPLRLPAAFSFKTLAGITAALILTSLVIHQAFVFPHGGWDAWQVWNFKARFLLLAGDEWKNLFAPELWRTSPHYPLLLPLINVWTGLTGHEPSHLGPLITSVIFTLITPGLICAALWQRARNFTAFLPGVILLSSPFYNLLGTSQYCDIVLSFYLLSVLLTIKDFPALAGILNGFLLFTKPEGMIASMILAGIGVVYHLKNNGQTFSNLKSFLCAFILCALPAAAFHLWLSPGNQTFINGFFSAEKPATLQRFVTIAGFIGFELISEKWRGMWFLVLIGLALAGRRLWSENKIALIFLTLYLGIIVAYYGVNTYFEIKWWLSVSLHRILFSFLPVFLLMIFRGILRPVEKETNLKEGARS